MWEQHTYRIFSKLALSFLFFFFFSHSLKTDTRVVWWDLEDRSLVLDFGRPYIYIFFFLLPFFFSIFMLYLIFGSLLRFHVTFTLRIITRVLRHRNSRTKPILIFKLQHVHALSIFLLTFPFFRAILVFLFYKIDQRLLPYHFFFVLFFPRPWSIARGVIRLKYSRQRYTRYVSGFSSQKFRSIAIDICCFYFWFLVYPLPLAFRPIYVPESSVRFWKSTRRKRPIERFYGKFKWAKDKIKKKKRNDIWTRVKINSRRQDRFKPYLGALHTNIERSHRYVRVDCCYFRPPIISFYVYVP